MKNSLLIKAAKPLVMGILNVTPDSFYDGGKFFVPEKMTNRVHENFMNRDRIWNEAPAVRRAKEMIAEGVSIIDIGGESTGPGSIFVPEKEELRRVVPVIKKIAPHAHKKRILISIDTYKAEVARQAIEAGADIINDVTALRADPEMAQIVAKYGTPVVLMYAKDSTPRTTRKKIRYRDVMKTVKNFLKKRIRFALSHGIKKSRIIIDPGMGAFISGIPQYSFEVLLRLSELKTLGFPILIGTSRKSYLGGNIGERLGKSLAAASLAFLNGANIVRVHDTKETVLLRNLLYNTGV